MGMKARVERVTVENVNVPGRTTQVDATKYEEMRRVLLKVLPSASPGVTQSEMFSAVVPHLSDAIFPGGKTSGWWVKCVQLDLEAKGLMNRDGGKPLRWTKS
tara:strand:+ start:89762 stop:90067 length:306 start_codon:yes stop_codon:yes gene_type:complete